MRQFDMVARVLAGLIAGAVLLGAQPQSDFELRHATLLKSAPPGLMATLRTRGGRTTFNLFEPIPLEVVFASAKPNAYSIELKEGWNAAGINYGFVVDQREVVIRNEEPGALYGIVCCKNERPYLTA